MDLITSLDNKKIKYLNKLKDKKFRDTEGLFIIETENLIEEACQSNLLEEVYLLEDSNLEFEVPTYYVTKEVMQKISSLKSPSKCLGVVKKIAPRDYQNRLLILDNIQDPGNLGTIIRSAVAFNIDTIVLGNTCVDLYNEKTIRASEGMLFKINILRKDLTPFLEELKKNNYTLYGTDVTGGKVLNTVTFSSKCGIVIGSEGKGISPEIKKLINQNIYIPMSYQTESLNASVAASIIMYEMSKKDYE